MIGPVSTTTTKTKLERVEWQGGGGARERERGTRLFIAFYSFRVGFGGRKGSGMMEGIIMVNQRTALRLLSSSLLCFRGRLTRLVSRSEPLVIPRLHTPPFSSLLILSLVASPLVHL